MHLEPDRVIPMFIWKNKELRIAKKILKTQRGEFDVTGITTYYLVIVVKIV